MNINLGLLSGMLLVAVPLLNGCAKPAGKPMEEVKSDKLIARVASIHKDEGYALIQRYGRINLGDDVILYTLSEEGMTSNLKITGEKLGQFLAVDIVSGELNIGDGVYLRNLTENDGIDNKDELIKEKA